MKLKKITIHKFKSINTDQSVNIEDDITILVGMNESGKTACLEAIAKTNYHQTDDKLSSFSDTHDYPRREKKNLGKGKASNKAITCEYEVDKDTVSCIEDSICAGAMKNKIISQTHKYGGNTIISIEVDYEPLQNQIISALEVPKDKQESIKNITDRAYHPTTLR